jgi:hypothetical protein
MSRRIFTLANDRIRDRAIEAIRDAGVGSRVEIKGPKRSHDQNAKMHAMLGDIAEQLSHYGQKLDVEDWKDVFMDELRRDHRLEARSARSLYGAGYVPLGMSTSDLDVPEFSDLIALIYAFGDAHGVEWSEPKPKDDRPVPPVEAYENIAQERQEQSPATTIADDSALPPTDDANGRNEASAA